MPGLFRRALVAALTVGAMCAFTLSVADAAAARTTRSHPRHHRVSVRAARRALVAYLKHNDGLELRAPSHRFGSPGSTASPASTTSYNWSGYDNTTSTVGYFGEVGGSWVVPRLTCSREDQLAADWVGIDGANDPTVEQDGTLGWCFEGVPTYYTWWEMYPTNSEQNVGTTVEPGDVITSTVTRSGQSYKLSVTDSTSPANSFSTSQACASSCNDTSVEWIAERPGFSIGMAPFADQHTWNLTGATQEQTGATAPGTISSGPNPTSIAMMDATGTYALSVPGSLNATGAKFADVWHDSW